MRTYGYEISENLFKGVAPIERDTDLGYAYIRNAFIRNNQLHKAPFYAPISSNPKEDYDSLIIPEATENKVWVINSASDISYGTLGGALTEDIACVDLSDADQSGNTMGKDFSLANFGKAFIFATRDERRQYMYVPTDYQTGEDIANSKILDVTDYGFDFAVCGAFQGRQMFANFSSLGLIADAYLETQPVGAKLRSPVSSSWGANFIMWSPVNVDILRYLYLHDEFYGEDVSKPNFLTEVIDREDFGFMFLPCGDIIAMGELEGKWIVYGVRGICVLTPIMDPVPTFSMQMISYLAPADYSGKYKSIAFGMREHLFVTEAKEWYRVSSKGIEPLGYRDLLNKGKLLHNTSDAISSTYMPSKMKLAYLPSIDLFAYMSDDANKSWILSSEGMTLINDVYNPLPDGRMADSETYYGYSFASFDGSTVSNNVLMVTSPFTFGRPGVKTIKQIEIKYADDLLYSDVDEDVTTLNVIIYYSFDGGRTWKSTTVGSISTVRTEGIMRCNVAAERFKIGLSGDNLDNVEALAPYLKIDIQFNDRRFTRSFNVSQNA